MWETWQLDEALELAAQVQSAGDTSLDYLVSVATTQREIWYPPPWELEKGAPQGQDKG